LVIGPLLEFRCVRVLDEEFCQDEGPSPLALPVEIMAYEEKSGSVAIELQPEMDAAREDKTASRRSFLELHTGSGHHSVNPATPHFLRGTIAAPYFDVGEVHSLICVLDGDHLDETLVSNYVAFRKKRGLLRGEFQVRRHCRLH
jgi:hypothetical protein